MNPAAPGTFSAIFKQVNAQEAALLPSLYPALVEQYDEKAALLSRLHAELRYVIGAAAKEHASLHQRLDYGGDKGRWAALFQEVLRSPWLREQIVDVCLRSREGGLLEL